MTSAEPTSGGGRKAPQGKAQGEVRARVKLRDDGKVAVLLAAGAGGEARGDFELNDDVDFVDLTGELEKMVEDRRSDVVGEIAVDAHAAPGGEGGEVGLEDVAGNDGEIGMFLREALQADNERGIEFDGDHRSATAKEMLGHFAVPGADFDPAVTLWERTCGTGWMPCGETRMARAIFSRQPGSSRKC